MDYEEKKIEEDKASKEVRNSSSRIKVERPLKLGSDSLDFLPIIYLVIGESFIRLRHTRLRSR